MFSLLTKAYTLVDSQLTDPPAVAQRAENKSRSSMTDEEWLNDWLNNDDFSNFFDEKVRHERTSMDDDFDAAMMHRDNMFDNAMSPLYDNHKNLSRVTATTIGRIYLLAVRSTASTASTDH